MNYLLIRAVLIPAALVGLALFAAWPVAALAQSASRRAQQSPAARQAAIARVVQSVIRPWMNKEQPPGVMVVVHERGVTHFFAYGYADRARGRPITADSIFELASITKVFCSTSLAMEVEAGRMRLTDSLANYIPQLAAGRSIRHVTLEELATHTSSLPRMPPPPPQGTWTTPLLINWLVGWQASHPPGAHSLYSNIAFGLLGQAIAEHEKRPLIEVWRQQMLGPLGMSSTFFEMPSERRQYLVQGYNREAQPVSPDPIGAWPAGGRLRSSGRDMAAFLAANLGERRDLAQLTRAMQLTHKPFFNASPKMVQGLAWQRVHLEGMLCLDKNGGLAGTSTHIGMIPGQGLGVVVLANRGKAKATTAGRQLLVALAGRQRQDPAAYEPEESGDESE